MTSDGAVRLQTMVPKAAVVHVAVPLEADKRAEQWARDQTGVAGMSDKRVLDQIFFLKTTALKRRRKLGGPKGHQHLGWHKLGNLDRDSSGLPALKVLQTLGLFNPYHFSDAGLNRLTSFKQVNQLTLGYRSQITDAGLRHLASLDQLSTLFAVRIAIRYNGLPSWVACLIWTTSTLIGARILPPKA